MFREAVTVYWWHLKIALSLWWQARSRRNEAPTEGEIDE